MPVKFNPQSKYKARKTEYKGILYDSKREAEYAFELDMLKRAGEITTWQRQIIYPLTVNEIKIASFRVDFVIIRKDRCHEVHEVKGFETPEYKLKAKLFTALYPDVIYRVIK